MHPSDVPDTGQGNIALTRINTIRVDVCCVNGLSLPFMHRDGIGQLHRKLPVSAYVDTRQSFLHGVVMISEQPEVLWMDIELCRTCINADTHDLSLGIGLNICYSTNRAVIILACIY